MEECQLLNEFVSTGSEEAFQKIVEKHKNMVFSSCLRGLNHDNGLAAEATQAVFIILAKKARGIKNGRALSAWLFRTSLSVVANIRRGESRRLQRETEAVALMENNIETEKEKMQADQVKALLNDAVSSLKPRQQEAIVLHILEGMSQKEVSMALGCSVDAVKQRIAYGLNKIRSFMLRRGIMISGVSLSAYLSNLAVEAAPVKLASATKSSTLINLAHSQLSQSQSLTIAQGTINMMFATKLKIAAVYTAVLLMSAGLCIPLMSNAHAKKSRSSSTKVQPNMNKKVKAFLKKVIEAPTANSLETRLEQVKEIKDFNRRELHAAVPELIKILTDKRVAGSVVPQKPRPQAGGGIVMIAPVLMDAAPYYINHRAAFALTVAAGISLGDFPVRGGYGPPPPANWKELDAETSAKLIADWKSWWKKNKGKSRKTWLKRRNPILKQQLGLTGEGKIENSFEVQKIISLAKICKDKKILPLLMQFMQKQVPAIELKPSQSSPISYTISAAVRLFELIGSTDDVKQLVALAKQCNNNLFGFQTNIPREFNKALNGLTELNLEMKEVKHEARIRNKLSIYKIKLIDENSFDKWLEAAQ